MYHSSPLLAPPLPRHVQSAPLYLSLPLSFTRQHFYAQKTTVVDLPLPLYLNVVAIGHDVELAGPCSGNPLVCRKRIKNSTPGELRVALEDVHAGLHAAPKATSDKIANRSKKAKRKVNSVNNDLEGKLGAILSNAKRLDIRGYSLRCSLGIDLGDVKTGIAASRGYAPRPISVVNFRGEKLEAHLLQAADREKADEFILGLPKSFDGKETHQSNKVRSFAGRLAARAAERGWRVYLQDEYGTSEDALNYMIDMGSTKRCRKERLDAYAAVVLLQMYFNSAGRLAEFVVPKNTTLQKLLCEGSMKILYLEDEFDGGDDNLLAEV